MSFLTYKLFVFRSKGRWWGEYLRSYVVYGAAALVGVLLLWFLVRGLGVNIWLAQGAVVGGVVLISYLGHASFTFRSDANDRSTQ